MVLVRRAEQETPRQRDRAAPRQERARGKQADGASDAASARWLRAPSHAVTAATALVALVTSAIALAFTLWPQLKPDPHETFRADVSVFAVDRGVTQGEYFRRTTFSAAAYKRAKDTYLASQGLSPGAASARAVLQLPGEVVYVESTLEGFKRQSVTLRWSMYEGQTQRRLPGKSFSGVSAFRVDVETPTDRTLQEVWIPPGPGRGPFFVRVALYDHRDVLLAVADSKPFTGTS